MDFQIKLFNWQDTGNHLIILARGSMDSQAFARLFAEIRAETQSLKECKILVDLSDSSCEIEGDEIERFVAGLQLERWSKTNKIAFIAAAEISNYHRLYFLRTALSGRGVSAEVFRNSKVAVDWLAGLI